MRKPAAQWLINQYNQSDKAIAVVSAYHRALKTDDVEIVLEDLRRYCNIYTTTACAPPNSPIDPVQMQINEGRRQAYLHLISMFGVNENDLIAKKGTPDVRARTRSPDGAKPKPKWGGDSPTIEGIEPRERPDITE